MKPRPQQVFSMMPGAAKPETGLFVLAGTEVIVLIHRIIVPGSGRFRLAGEYDVIVVGAGHAGCEAALAAARMGCETLLFNINLDSIALMSCNPAIGGLAKSQLVKEIDALGGEMGRIADRTAVHYRLLNASKGPAVQSTRLQCDKQRYRLAMKAVVEREQRLHLRQGLVVGLIVEDGRIRGVVDQTGVFHGGRAVVITTGTFLGGLIHIGEVHYPAGRAGEIASSELSAILEGARLRDGADEDRDAPEASRLDDRFLPPPPAGQRPRSGALLLYDRTVCPRSASPPSSRRRRRRPTASSAKTSASPPSTPGSSRGSAPGTALRSKTR